MWMKILAHSPNASSASFWTCPSGALLPLASGPPSFMSAVSLAFTILLMCARGRSSCGSDMAGCVQLQWPPSPQLPIVVCQVAPTGHKITFSATACQLGSSDRFSLVSTTQE